MSLSLNHDESAGTATSNSGFARTADFGAMEWLMFAGQKCTLEDEIYEIRSWYILDVVSWLHFRTVWAVPGPAWQIDVVVIQIHHDLMRNSSYHVISVHLQAHCFLAIFDERIAYMKSVV